MSQHTENHEVYAMIGTIIDEFVDVAEAELSFLPHEQVYWLVVQMVDGIYISLHLDPFMMEYYLKRPGAGARDMLKYELYDKIGDGIDNRRHNHDDED